VTLQAAVVVETPVLPLVEQVEIPVTPPKASPIAAPELPVTPPDVPVKPVAVELLPVELGRALNPPPAAIPRGDAPVRVNGQGWLLRASRQHSGQEWALLLSPDRTQAAACLLEAVEMLEAVAADHHHGEEQQQEPAADADAAAKSLAKAFDGEIIAADPQDVAEAQLPTPCR
jgi:hypothetical protein